MKSEGGRRETAREIYQQMYDEAADTQTRENALLRLLQLDSLDERDGLDFVLLRFKEKSGRCANRWREIFTDLRNVRLANGKDFRIDETGDIVDPSNVPYVLDKKDCKAKLNIEESRIPPN